MLILAQNEFDTVRVLCYLGLLLYHLIGMIIYLRFYCANYRTGTVCARGKGKYLCLALIHVLCENSCRVRKEWQGKVQELYNIQESLFRQWLEYNASPARVYTITYRPPNCITMDTNVSYDNYEQSAKNRVKVDILSLVQ